MQVRTLSLGPLQTNCHLVWDEESKEAAVIDPAAEPERILALVREKQLNVRYVIDTHGHADHILANSEVQRETGAPLCIGERDAPLLTDSLANLSAWAGFPYRAREADRLLREGEELPLGSFSLRVLDTPGHTPGGISLLAPGCVFAGDCLFEGSVGRTDFPGGSHEQLIASIRDKLLTLPDDTVVYTGHGPSTTIGHEREYNPFL